MKGLFLLHLYIFSAVAFGQNQKKDSLLVQLKNAEEDTNMVWIYLDLAFDHYRHQEDSFFYYTDKGLNLSDRLDFTKGKSVAYTNRGIYYSVISEFDKAFSSFQEGYQISLEAEDTTGILSGLNNMSIALKKKGDYFNAIKYLNESLRLLEITGNLDIKGRTLNNIGSVYFELAQYQKAVSYLLESLEIKKSINDTEGFFSTLSNIASVYFSIGDYERSIKYYEQALNSDSSLNKMLSIGKLYQGLASAYQELGNYEESLRYYDLSFKLANEENDRLLAGDIHYHVGMVHVANGDYETASRHLESALEIFESVDNRSEMAKVELVLAKVFLETNRPKGSFQMVSNALKTAKKYHMKSILTEAYEILYQLNKRQGNYKEAIKYLELHKLYNDSLMVELNKKELLVYENKADLIELQNENIELASRNVLNEAELVKNKLLIERQKLIMFGSVIVLLLLGGYTYLLFRYIKNRRGTVRLLMKKNEEIERQAEVLKEQAEALIQSNEKIKLLNQSLEKEVEDRTAKILTQNEKLKEYAFSNAHLVRAPLARILGLVDLLISSDLTENQRKEFRVNLKTSAYELDQIIRKVSDVLRAEELQDN